MKLDELLATVESVAADNQLSKPLIVGGVCRDRLIGLVDEKSEIKDIDITTGNKDSLKLAVLLGQKLEGSRYATYDDGHASIDYLGIHLDFSSNFVISGVESEIVKAGKKPSPMLLELYSRDFTINTLLETLDFTAMYDLTSEGINDIKTKIIRCPINPEITIGVDPRRILRAIKFSLKFGFAIEDGLKTAMLNNHSKITTLPPKFIQDKATEIVTLGGDKGIDMLIEYKLLPLIPLTKTLSDILIQKRRLVSAL
jgi:tRNA nucleotidyltransferase/poly(A) polymerase